MHQRRALMVEYACRSMLVLLLHAWHDLCGGQKDPYLEDLRYYIISGGGCLFRAKLRTGHSLAPLVSTACLFHSKYV